MFGMVIALKDNTMTTSDIICGVLTLLGVMIVFTLFSVMLNLAAIDITDWFRRKRMSKTEWSPSNPCKQCKYYKIDDGGTSYCSAPKRDCLPHQKYIEIHYYQAELLNRLRNMCKDRLVMSVVTQKEIEDMIKQLEERNGK